MSMIYADDVPMSERPLLDRVRHLLAMVDRGVISEKHMADLMGKIEPVKTWNEHAWEEQIEDTWEAMIEPKLALAKSVERVRELEEAFKLALNECKEQERCIAELKRDEEHLHSKHEFALGQIKVMEEDRTTLRIGTERMGSVIMNQRTQLCIYGERVDAAEQALKVMTEDRDEYRAKAAQNSLMMALPFGRLMKDATDDERAVVLAFTRKVMGEGRKEYGPLNLSTDTRTAEQLRAEQRDEWLDSEFYGIVAGMKEGQAGPSDFAIQSAIDAILGGGWRPVEPIMDLRRCVKLAKDARKDAKEAGCVPDVLFTLDNWIRTAEEMLAEVNS